MCRMENFEYADGNNIKLHAWYVSEVEKPEGEKYLIGNGIVTGHPEIQDSVAICTSEIISMYTDYEKGELVLQTHNSKYHCPLEYCQWRKQDDYKELIPDYDKIKELYEGKNVYPSIESGKVLLVLADFCEYYFHSLYCMPLDEQKPVTYVGYPHIGMLQDSYLIKTKEHSIEVRYFPHFRNIEIYMVDTNDMPLYLENVGESTLYVKTRMGTIKLNPGERKQVIKENTERKPPVLPRGDLYPARLV